MGSLLRKRFRIASNLKKAVNMFYLFIFLSFTKTVYERARNIMMYPVRTSRETHAFVSISGT